MSKFALANLAYVLIGCVYVYWRMFFSNNGSVIREMSEQARHVYTSSAVFIAGVSVGLCFAIISWPILVVLRVIDGKKG